MPNPLPLRPATEGYGRSGRRWVYKKKKANIKQKPIFFAKKKKKSVIEKSEKREGRRRDGGGAGIRGLRYAFANTGCYNGEE